MIDSLGRRQPATAPYPEKATRGGRWLTAAPLLVGCLLLAMSLALTSWFIAREQEANAEIRRTLEVTGRLAAVLSLLQDAETGQRGYLLSGEESYLAPYEAARGALSAELAALRQALVGDPGQMARLTTLAPLVDAKRAELERTIEVRRRGDVAQATVLMREGGGKALMDEARDLIGTMRANEEAALMEQQAATEAAGRWVRIGVLDGLVILTVLAWLALRETSRRASLQRFLPAELVPLLASRRHARQRGRRQTVAIIFVDIRGSTALAEHLDPQRLAVLLAAFRRRVMRAAAEHGAVVDKFIGDGAMLVIGVPEPGPSDASRALACARRLLELIDRWNRKRAPAEPLRIGIGVHLGEVFCGVLGDASRLEFTVLGDTVNVAARLEEATKTHATPLLASNIVVEGAGEGSSWHEVAHGGPRGREGAVSIMAPGASRPGHADALPMQASSPLD